MSFRAAALAVALVGALVLPAAAQAEKFAGQTEQNKRILLRTGPDDRVRGIFVQWKTDNCSGPFRLKLTPTAFAPPLDRSKPGFFVDRGQYRVRYPHARARYAVGIRGRQDADGRWQGTFRAKAFIKLETGDDFTCKLRRIGWTAGPR